MSSSASEHAAPLIRLRPTSETDLGFVTDAEQSAGNREFVTVWNREEHRRAASSEDERHFIIESGEQERVGYVLLAGLSNRNDSIELRRLVITEKGKGYGRAALRVIKTMAFDELRANRLWLDVKEHNSRARQLYESEGFVTEGVLRECIRTDSGYESLVVMSILKSQYHPR